MRAVVVARVLAAGACGAAASAALAVTLATGPSAAAVAKPESTIASRSVSTPPSTTAVPVYAYFYQWFSPSSWNRAKQDLPLVGAYSSDDPKVLSQQVEEARAAGISGFLTSWKSTATLNARLDLLISEARAEHFDVGVVYEALDFSRKPLPIATVRSDMVYLVTTRGAALTSAYYGRPIVIWTGTDQYSVSDVQSVRSALGDRAYLLAAAKSVAGYERIAAYVDGEAYYWSSANPSSPATEAKLTAFSDAVHAHHGIWIAPAASGYDGRDLGGSRVVGRAHGQTLVRSLENAFTSSPDAVSVISWNEWSENTYIEPGHTYGSEELTALQSYLRKEHLGIQTNGGLVDSSSPGSSRSSWTGAQATLALSGGTVAGIVALGVRQRRRSRYRPVHAGGTHPSGGPSRTEGTRRLGPVFVRRDLD